MLTDTQKKALTIIRDHKVGYPRQFGELLWGRDHPGWRRISKAGPCGSTVGGGMNLAAGGYLGKLWKKGWIRPPFRAGQSYRLTEAGRQELEASNAED